MQKRDEVGTVLYIRVTRHIRKGASPSHDNLFSKLGDISLSTLDPTLSEAFLSILLCRYVWERTAMYSTLIKDVVMVYSIKADFAWSSGNTKCIC